MTVSSVLVSESVSTGLNRLRNRQRQREEVSDRYFKLERKWEKKNDDR